VSVTPDELIYWQAGWFNINATIAFTWIIMAIMVVFSWLVTRNLTSGTKISRGQNFLEIIVKFLRDQIRDVSGQNPDVFLPFIGTLFLFIALSNTLSIIPFFEPPTGSLSTTAALAILVFLAVPVYGIGLTGLGTYLRQYLKPSFIMLPFNIIGEVSRSLALAVRLFGNIMSGRMIIAILLVVTPLFFPVIMQALGLLIGIIQAYIFTMLAIVYIGAATEARRQTNENKDSLIKGDA